MKKKSAREDGRGHWPKGKHRHAEHPEWSAVRKALARLLRDPEYGSGKLASGEPVRSRRGLAAAMGVSDRQVRRWLADDDLPSSERVEQIKQWMANWG